MNDIRLIAVDMDGTLLDSDHQSIPRRNISALRAAAARGVKVCIASGRAWSLVQDAAEALGPLDYAVTSGGAATLDVRTDTWIGRDCIPHTQCLGIMRILKARGVGYEIFCDGRSYMERWCREQLDGLILAEAYKGLIGRKIDLVEDAVHALAGRPVEKLHIFYIAPELRADLIGELETAGPFEVCTGTRDNLEITSPGVDKGKALAELCAGRGIPRESVMAFGDADNDLGMLAWAGWSFAMENGTDGAKAAARFLTTPNHNAGVGRAVEQYVLNL